MYLQRLEINGFKSFAKKTTLEFNQGITGIVGPNGSGKSNVAEAVRWVMGEQSIKSLRGKTSTDVIFSGSDKSARLGLAEVSLHFNNEDPSTNSGQATVIDYSEITLTRRIHRDGHSDYLLNGQVARLQDILLLLAQINLSSKTYSVIGQGMVDDILTTTPLQRKDFFEEASGVKPLQMKKNEALRKLDHTAENLQTVNIQLSEISPRLRSLTRQVKKLERRAEIENELRDKQFHYYGESLFSLSREKTGLQKKENEQQKEIDKLQAQVNKLQELMFSLTKTSSHSDKFSQAQKNYEEFINQKSKLKDQELEIKAQLLESVKSSQQTHVPIAVVREVETKFEAIVKKFKTHQSKTQAHKSLADWQTWHHELDKVWLEHESLLQPFKPYLHEQNISKKEQELKKLQKEILAVEEGLNKIQQEIKDLAAQEKEEKSKIWQTQNNLQEQQTDLNQLINQRNETRVDLARVEAHLADLETEVTGEVGNEFLNKIHAWQPVNKQADLGHTDQLKEKIHKLKHEIDLIGGIDPEVQKEYSEIKERYDFLSTQTDDLAGSIKQLDEVIDELDETIKKQFNDSFRTINQEFQKYFKMLFRGGRSELKLLKGTEEPKEDSEEIDELDELAEKKQKSKTKDVIIGVDITATPPGKKLKSITMLSGGERALTSIALISAIIANNPAPFVVLDEVDAALDEENSMRFAEIVNELSSKTQFVIITHNRATMEHADLLYGVTMGDDGISKLLSLKLESAQEYTNR
jgi:chromosome segregation ATPase